MSDLSTQRVVINNELGLHLRAAGAVVQLACKFDSDIKLQHGRVEANAKSIMSVLSLAAGRGAELLIVAQGNDGAAAVDKLAHLIQAGFLP